MRQHDQDETPYGSAVRELLAEWLDQRKWTQQDLADRLDRPQSFVSKIVNREKVTLDIDLVMKIIDAFELPHAAAWRTIEGRIKRNATAFPNTRSPS